MKILQIIPNTVVDGPHLRTSIYISGCKHNCKGCHNPQSHDFNAGTEITIQDLINKILSLNCNYITLSGGDPLYSAIECCELCKKLKELNPNFNIWVYTGFEFEYVKHFEIMKYIDVLCDGPFMERLKDTSLPFRGSSNQRLIDVPASLKSGKIILFNN